ncbi:plasmid partitioning protein RepB [Rhizobium sp. RU36D]|uniref:plasmid partitioning protein RepB n=1 Tax=Rhizobium sp. RU36D TaxID=1907415 RepID=UPI0009D87A58|nr:plasmid partitioning protein RepB [Rhizobium sp. RU36D]SMC71206.1 chromosome partitioning protein, ParB family [Rhizobium sp. RU36D]
MARKDVFANITATDSARPERKATPGYATRGASRSMINSLGELAERAAKAEQIMEGEAVVDLDPALLDDSFVSDRLDDDEVAFGELVEAIRERGQDSPILVRPHPTALGRYQVVFGHRRLKAARLLEKPVRAVIKPIADLDHVIAQGQENSARENLSFIERAVFAQKLQDLAYDRATIQKALSVDAPMLTRMLSVAGRVPHEVLKAIGAAKGIGRDRWLDLAQLLERPDNTNRAIALVKEVGFAESPSEHRFERIVSELKKVRRSVKSSAATATWQSGDQAVKAEYKNTGKSFTLALKARDAGKFGRFLSENLERFYDEFRKEGSEHGD